MKGIENQTKEFFISDAFVNVNNEMVGNINLKDLDIITYILAKQQMNLKYNTLLNVDYIFNMLEVTKPTFYADIKESLINLYNNNYIELRDIKYNLIEAQDFLKLKPKDNFIIIFDDNTEYFQVEDLTLDKIIQLSKNFKSRFQYEGIIF